MAIRETDGKARNLVALAVVWLSILGTVLLGITGIWFAWNLKRETQQVQTLQYVFAALLPLWGTWMGTVMAYYFSKENFLAANQSVQRLVEQITPDQKLKATKCSSVMVRFEDIKPFPLTSSESIEGNTNQGEQSQKASDPIDEIAIVSALEFMKENKVTRLPLFEKDKRVLKYIIHQSTFEKFITELSLTTKEVLELHKLKIKDMLTRGSDRVKGFLTSGAEFLNLDSNLKEAQFRIEKNPFSQDVFITSTGKAGEDVIGWVTNGIIAENAKDLQLEQEKK